MVELYHGSRFFIEEEYLKPMPSNILSKEEVVFASDDKDVAVIFIGNWTDEDFEFGKWTGYKFNIIEKYKGAVERKLNISGYVYTVGSENFERDYRLGLNEEYINKNKVKILERQFIKNVLSYIKERNDKFSIIYK